MNWLTNGKQFEFWKLRRARMSNKAIAVSFGISRQAVSKALLKADEKVEIALRDMATANRIAIMKINPKLGVLLGRTRPAGHVCRR